MKRYTPTKIPITVLLCISCRNEPAALFDWAGDFIPDTYLVCPGAPVDLHRATTASAAWADHGWPSWPAPEYGRCIEPAPLGWVQVRHCGEVLGGNVACPELDQIEGIRTAHDGEGRVLAADIFLWEWAPPCGLIHGIGHARGLDHIGWPDNVMNLSCGEDWTGLTWEELDE